ncbi:hypothetical protein BDP81DRAFT_502032, partial [Colletotrichum phormii]
ELERQLTDSKRAYDAHVRQRDLDHQREIRGLKGHICDFEAARSAEKTIANRKKVSDTAILEIWQQMAYNIRAVATTLLTYCQAKEELEKGFQTCQTTAVGMTPFEYDLLANEDMRSAIVLISEFFSSNGLVYQLTYLFGIAAVSLDTAPEFLKWRSEGAAMVEDLFGPQ